MLSVKFRNKEVKSPLAHVAVTTALIIFAILLVIFAIALICVVIVTSPLWLLSDLILKWRGRNGFVRHAPNRLSFSFVSDAFNKRLN